MRVELKSVNTEVHPSMKDYAEKKVKKINKFWSKITDVIVYFKEQNSGNSKKLVELKALVPDNTLIITEEGDTFGEAIDLAVERMIRQIKRYKDKHNSH